MEFKYYVFKKEDCDDYLREIHLLALNEIGYEIDLHREREGKKRNKYLVINTDEPYANEVIDIMKRYGHWE